jgi:NADP-dependent 3-hydroxy acid dehydrogenase YdfG
MLQPEDCADLVLYVSCLPQHVCLNDALIFPSWNRDYVAAQRQQAFP